MSGRGISTRTCSRSPGCSSGAAPEKPETQPLRIGLVSGRSFGELKGVLETLVRASCRRPRWSHSGEGASAIAAGARRGAAWSMGKVWGLIGEVNRDAAACSG